tara:strand:- start:584 stop:700 length:117 start_codon:yes stop_codon:yes gene_type:complete
MIEVTAPTLGMAVAIVLCIPSSGVGVSGKEMSVSQSFL